MDDQPPPPSGGFGVKARGSRATFPVPPVPPARSVRRVLVGLALGCCALIALATARRIYFQTEIHEGGGTPTAEAPIMLQRFAERAVAAYERATPHALCGSASHPIPRDLSMLSNRTYATSLDEWNADEGDHKGFACLGPYPDIPFRYQYDYKSDGRSFELTAHGDANHPGFFVTYRLRGRVIDGRVELTPVESDEWKYDFRPKFPPW